jgi:hypothetical protein
MSRTPEAVRQLTNPQNNIYAHEDKNFDSSKAEYPITAMLIFSDLCSTYLAIKT